jgi:hypothetical protein
MKAGDGIVFKSGHMDDFLLLILLSFFLSMLMP